MRKILGIIFVCIFISFNATAQNGKSLDKIAAVVGSAIILQSDLESQYAQYLAQGNPEKPDIKCYFLQQLITQKLLSQQAIIDSVAVTELDVDNEVDRRLRVFMQRAGGEAELEKFLNRPILQYKDEIRQDIKEMLVANKMQHKITEKVAVTPLDVKRYFEGLTSESIPSYNTEVEVGEVVLYPKPNKEEKQSFFDKAQALQTRIKAGEDFSVLARLYSQDPGSAAEGGDLGFFDRSQMVKEFAATAFKLKPGEVSQVFESEFGYHVMKVEERRGEQVHARHILIRVEPTKASLERSRLHIDSLYNDVVAGKLPFSTAASAFSDNNDTKFNGGMILNAEDVQSRTTYIPTDKLDPDIFLVIDTMKVGTYSKPYLFTKDGKQGYRFLYLKSRTEPHKANLDQDFPKIKEIAFEDKTSRAVSEWFEKRRKTTYIKIDSAYNDCPDLKLWTNAQ